MLTVLESKIFSAETIQRRKEFKGGNIWGNTEFVFPFQMDHHLITLQKCLKEKSWIVSILGQAWCENNKWFQSISINFNQLLFYETWFTLISKWTQSSTMILSIYIFVTTEWLSYHFVNKLYLLVHPFWFLWIVNPLFCPFRWIIRRLNT